MKIKLKIGEFSKMNQVTVKTLRHYEEIGLLIPQEVDEWTGYRYYTVDQFKTMTQIHYLKRLGFSLDEIKSLFEQNLSMPTFEQIAEKQKSCAQEIKQLQWRQAELVHLEKSLQRENKMEQITIKSLPASIVASHRQIIKSYDELFNLCPNVIGPEMARLGCECPEPQYCFTIEHDVEHKERNIDIEYCEAVAKRGKNSELVQFKEIKEVPIALCVNHFGSYNTFGKTFGKLYEYLEANGYRIVDSPRFCYIDGIWNKESEAEWCTEIQVPVKLDR